MKISKKRVEKVVYVYGYTVELDEDELEALCAVLGIADPTYIQSAYENVLGKFADKDDEETVSQMFKIVRHTYDTDRSR